MMMLDKIFSRIERFVPERWRWILSHDGFKRYFANTGWMFGGQIFSLVVSFFVGAWLARYLGPENYGSLNYALAFSGMFGFLSSLGVDAILSRELVKRPDQEGELMGTAFRMKLIGGLIAFVAASVVVLLIPVPVMTKLMVVIFSLTFILQSLNVINIFFQAKVKAVNNVKAQIAATLISSVLKIIIILISGSVFLVMVVYALDFLWQGISFVLIYNRAGSRIGNWRFNGSLAKDLWRDSWPLMLTGAAVFVYIRIDQVLVGWLLGESAVGIYSAAVKISEAWYFIPSIICASLFPAIVNAKKTDSGLYRRRLNSLYILLVSLAVVISIIIMFISRPMITLLFGQKYLEAIPILRLYAWSSVGLFWGWAISQYLVAESSLKLMFIVNLLSMLANVGLNLVLIPFFGLLGAAYATLISYFVTPIIILTRRFPGDSEKQLD